MFTKRSIDIYFGYLPLVFPEDGLLVPGFGAAGERAGALAAVVEDLAGAVGAGAAGETAGVLATIVEDLAAAVGTGAAGETAGVLAAVVGGLAAAVGAGAAGETAGVLEAVVGAGVRVFAAAFGRGAEEVAGAPDFAAVGLAEALGLTSAASIRTLAN